MKVLQPVRNKMYIVDNLRLLHVLEMRDWQQMFVVLLALPCGIHSFMLLHASNLSVVNFLLLVKIWKFLCFCFCFAGFFLFFLYFIVINKKIA